MALASWLMMMCDELRRDASELGAGALVRLELSMSCPSRRSRACATRHLRPVECRVIHLVVAVLHTGHARLVLLNLRERRISNKEFLVPRAGADRFVGGGGLLNKPAPQHLHCCSSSYMSVTYYLRP